MATKDVHIEIPVFRINKETSQIEIDKETRGGKVTTERIAFTDASKYLGNEKAALKVLSDATTHEVKDKGELWQAVAALAVLYVPQAAEGIPTEVNGVKVHPDKRARAVSSAFRAILAGKIVDKEADRKGWNPSSISQYLGTAARAVIAGVQLVPAEGKVIPYSVARGVRTNVKTEQETLAAQIDSFGRLLDRISKRELADAVSFRDSVTPRWNEFLEAVKDGKIGPDADMTDQNADGDDAADMTPEQRAIADAAAAVRKEMARDAKKQKANVTDIRRAA